MEGVRIFMNGFLELSAASVSRTTTIVTPFINVICLQRCVAKVTQQKYHLLIPLQKAGAVVDVISSAGVTQLNLSRFESKTTNVFNGRDGVVRLVADRNIVVSCRSNGADFSVLLPLKSVTVYHWDSTNTRLSSVDCATMNTTNDVPVSNLLSRNKVVCLVRTFVFLLSIGLYER